MEHITERFVAIVEDCSIDGAEIYSYSVLDLAAKEIAIPAVADISDALSAASALNYYTRGSDD